MGNSAREIYNTGKKTNVWDLLTRSLAVIVGIEDAYSAITIWYWWFQDYVSSVGFRTDITNKSRGVNVRNISFTRKWEFKGNIQRLFDAF